MTTLKDVSQQILQANQPTNTVSTTRKSPMELMMLQLAAAQNSDPQTMTGLALGKLLRGLFDDWKERYDARGLLKNLEKLDPKQRDEIWASLEKNNPQQYQLAQDYLATDDRWSDLRQDAPQTSAPDEINQNATARVTPNLLGNTDFLNRQNTADWDKYKNLDDALSSARVGWRHDWRF